MSKCGPQIYTFRKLEGPFKGGDKECTAIQLGKCLITVSVDKMLNNCFTSKQYYQHGISNTLLWFGNLLIMFILTFLMNATLKIICMIFQSSVLRMNAHLINLFKMSLVKYFRLLVHWMLWLPYIMIPLQAQINTLHGLICILK